MSEAEQVQLLNSLHELGAREIVFNFLPSRNTRQFFQRAAELKTVVFGRRLYPNANDPERLEVESWPASARDLSLPWGVVELAPAVKGVYRQAHAYARVGTNVFPTFEMRTASQWEGGTPGGALHSGGDVGYSTAPFLVSFVGRAGSIPCVEVSRVLRGDLVSSLVKGRTVLIGSDPGLIEMETPVSTGGQTMTLLEFQANVMQTLIDGTAIRVLPAGYTLLLLIGLGLISSILYQRFHSVNGLRLTLGLALICVLGSLLVLGLTRVWVPAGVLVLAQASQFGFTVLFKSRLTSLALNDLRLHFLGQAKERPCPDNFFFSAEYWDCLLAMVNQVLGAERMVFFTRVPRQPRLREARLFKCRSEEIQETERSLDAELYANAIKAQAPVRVFNFLKPGGPAEDQYLCPLIFSGEVFGIWVVGIDGAKVAADPAILMALAQLSDQVAWLLHEQRRIAPAPTLAWRLNEWFSAGREARSYYELKSAAAQLEQYYEVLETLLSRVSTGIIVYDWFGRVLYANEPALKVLRAENCTVTRLSAAETLRQLACTDEAQSRSLLSRVVLQSSPVSLSIKLSSQGDRQFLLRLYPLSGSDESKAEREAFSGHGIVFELLDTTLFSNLATLKGVVADRLGVELRDHLGAIEVSAALLESESLSSTERAAVLGAVHQKTASCVHVLTECQKYLGRDVDAHAINCHPLDALELLAEVCGDLAPKALDRRVTFRIEQPRLMEHVLASRTELKKLFATAIELLLRDAAENTDLTIVVENAPELTTFRFSNCGFGIPDDRLQQILTSSAAPASEEFQVLRDALAWVRDWSGSLEITSGVGTGYSIVLKLKQFQLTSFLTLNTP